MKDEDEILDATGLDLFGTENESDFEGRAGRQEQQGRGSSEEKESDLAPCPPGPPPLGIETKIKSIQISASASPSPQLTFKDCDQSKHARSAVLMKISGIRKNALWCEQQQHPSQSLQSSAERLIKPDMSEGGGGGGRVVPPQYATLRRGGRGGPFSVRPAPSAVCFSLT